jgi:hypothetical protein
MPDTPPWKRSSTVAFFLNALGGLDLGDGYLDGTAVAQPLGVELAEQCEETEEPARVA